MRLTFSMSGLNACDGCKYSSIRYIDSIHLSIIVGLRVCVSYVLSLSGALVRTLCTKPVRLAICFSIASIRSLLKRTNN